MPEIIPSMVFEHAELAQHQQSVPPLVQRHTLNTIIEDDSAIPRYYFTPRYSPSLSGFSYAPSNASPAASEDFPTPKARLFDIVQSSMANTQFEQTPQPSPQHRISMADSDFDSLYDITDDEAEVPLKCSASVKQVARSSRNRYPSIIIPSPSAWPTIEKLKSALSEVPPTPGHLMTPSEALSSFAARNMQVPASSATPSLDGSMTSEEMEQLSCPATPETSNRESTSLDDWSGPVQLDTQAFETLQHLGTFPNESRQNSRPTSQVLEAPPGEMQEVSRPRLGLAIPSSLIQSNSLGTTPVSALSIPSPGGFFSSLGSSARHTWSMPQRVEESVPNTSTAENFYQVPWKIEPRPIESRRNTIAEQTITLAGSTLDGFTDGLPTSRPVMITGDSDDAVEVKEINPSKTIFQHRTEYQVQLQKLASENLERTDDWLTEQDELQAALRDMYDMSPNISNHSRGNSLDKAVKKSVRFQEKSPQSSPTTDQCPKKIVTYVQGWEFIRHRSRKNDPFIHRQTRSEALHIQRRCTPHLHRAQLLGKFELTNPVRPSPPRPVSEFYTDDPTALKERIARAQTERQALDQMLPITWVLQALKQLLGGRLLSTASSRTLSRTRQPRILDVGGVPNCDWAWEICYSYPYTTVITVYTAGQNLSSNIAGPGNHKHLTVPNLWTLPFPSGHFDVISARTLYEVLKTTTPVGKRHGRDEYDLVLRELFRVLKPNGILEFSLIDADIVHAEGTVAAQAMGVEFGFNLKTRGYDSAPTKSFLPKLRKAGWKTRDMQRAWMVLPMGKTAANWKDVLPVGVCGSPTTAKEKCISPDGTVEVNDVPVLGTTGDAAMLAGLVGAWWWEKWLLKLQVEMGKEEGRLLEGVTGVLEEGCREGVGAGWRWLVGYARKT